MKNQSAHLQIQVYRQNKNSSSDFSKQQTLDENNLKPQILINIKQVTASSLRIQDTPRPSIVKQISQIIFSKLIDLNLRNSSITNIEFIQYLRCPVLLTLELYANYITNLKSLSKNQTLPKLRLVTVYRNPLKQNWPLNRQFMPQYREFQLNNNNQITIEDISFLAKNPGRKITKIYLNGKDRIQQKKVKKIFSQLKKFDNY